MCGLVYSVRNVRRTGLMNIVLEKPEEFEVETLAEIATEAYEGVPEEKRPEGYNVPREHSNKMKYDDYYKIYVDEHLAGAIIIGLRGDLHHELVQLFLRPAYQRKGIGTKSFEKILEMCPDVKLWTTGVAEGSSAIEFIEKLGFTKIGNVMDGPEKPMDWFEKRLEDLDFSSAIGPLEDGMKNLIVEGTVDEKAFPRMVRSRRGRGSLSVTETTFIDDTGRIVLSLWNEQIKQVQVGDRVRVENGYVQSYRGIKQLGAGKSGRIVVLDA